MLKHPDTEAVTGQVVGDVLYEDDEDELKEDEDEGCDEG